MKVNSLVSAGGPLDGVDEIPKCTASWCSTIDYLAAYLCYHDWMENHIAPCGYLRTDNKNLDDQYKKYAYL